MLIFISNTICIKPVQTGLFLCNQKPHACSGGLQNTKKHRFHKKTVFGYISELLCRIYYYLFCTSSRSEITVNYQYNIPILKNLLIIDVNICGNDLLRTTFGKFNIVYVQFFDECVI